MEGKKVIQKIKKIVRLVFTGLLVALALTIVFQVIFDSASRENGRGLLGLALFLVALVAWEWTKGAAKVISILVTISALLFCLFSLVGFIASSRDDYAIKANVTEAYGVAKEVQQAVNRYHEEDGKFPDSNQMANLRPPAEVKGSFVRSVGIEKGGMVTVIFNNKIDKNITGKTIQFRPTVTVDGKQLVWDCLGGSVPKKYRSSNC